MRNLNYALAFSAAVLLPACSTVYLEPYVVAPTAGSEEPALEVDVVVRGAARAKFLLVGREPGCVVLRRRDSRRSVEVAAWITPHGLEIEHLRSRGFRAANGRIHTRYYALLDELALGIRTEQYASSVATRAYVPVEMQASTTQAEVTPGGTVTTTRAARVSTFVPPGETRYSVSAERPPTAGAMETTPSPVVAEKSSP